MKGLELWDEQNAGTMASRCMELWALEWRCLQLWRLGARSTGSLSELKQSIGRVNVGKRWVSRSRAHFDARRV